MVRLFSGFSLVALVAFAIFGGACASNDDPTTAAYWMDRLDDKKTRVEALKELAKIGDKAAVPAVTKYLKESGDWQPDAAYTLGQLGDPSVVPDLIASIDFGAGTGRESLVKQRVNQNVAKALVALGAKKEAEEPLTRLLSTPELRTRQSVIEALGELGAEKSVKTLSELASSDDNPFIRKTAIIALGNIGSADAIPTLIDALFVEMPGVSFYFEARYALIQLGKQTVPALIEAFERKNESVEAIRMGDGEPIAEGAVEAKTAFVMSALRATETEEMMIGAFKKFYKKAKAPGPKFASIPGAAQELAYALGHVGSEKSVKALSPMALDDDLNMRVAATEALTTIGSADAEGVLLKASKSGNLEARRAAILALTRVGDASVADKLDGLAKGDDKAALGKILVNAKPRLEAAKECGDDDACWQKKLEDKSPVVRERAAYQLGWNEVQDAKDALLKAAEDDDAGVRMAAVLSLGRVGGADPKTLEDIHAKWKDKLAYKNANAALRRLIARSKSKS